MILQCVDTDKTYKKKKNPCLLSRNLRLSQFLRTHKRSDIIAPQSCFSKLILASQQACSSRQWYAVKPPVSFSLCFMRYAVLLSCIFTPLSIHAWLMARVSSPSWEKLYQSVFLFICMFVYSAIYLWLRFWRSIIHNWDVLQ